MEQIGFIGGGVVLGAAAFLVVKYFPKEIAEFVRRLGAPSTSAVKSQSDRMLAQMETNVAERKAKLGR